MAALVTLFDRRAQRAIGYELPDDGDTVIGFSEDCSIRIDRIPHLPQLFGFEQRLLKIRKSGSDSSVYLLSGMFKKMQMAGGLVYGIMQPSRRQPHECVEASSIDDESFQSLKHCTLELKDGDNFLLFFLHRQPTRVTPVCHLQLKLVGESDETSDDEVTSIAERARRLNYFPLENLTEELQLAVFSKLPFEWRCCVLPAVCREFFRLSRSPSYWNRLDLNSISIGSFYLFNSLKESLLPCVERLSLIEKIVLTWRGRATLVKGSYKSFLINVEDWFHPGLIETTVCSPRLGFSASSPAALDLEGNFSLLVVRLTTFRIQYSSLAAFEGSFPFHLMVSLKTLVIRCDARVSELRESDLDSISRLENLQELTLAHCASLTYLEWSTFFEELLSADLRTLRLPDCHLISDDHLSVIARRFPFLAGLETSHAWKITDRGLASFLARMKSLECIKVVTMPQLFGDFWAEPLREAWPRMRIIHVRDVGCDELVASLNKCRGEMGGEWENMVAEEFPLF